MGLQQTVSRIELDTRRQIVRLYNDAMNAAIRQTRSFFKAVQDIETGKVKPPSDVRTDRQLAAWKETSKRRLAREQDIYGVISGEMRQAGVKARALIVGQMTKIYRAARQQTLDGLHGTGFDQYTDRQIVSLLYGEKRGMTFSKIALNHLRNGRNAASMLRREMSEGFAKGESRDGLLARIRKIAQSLISAAMRILRTESTKTESTAQQTAAEEYSNKTGFPVYKRWCCVFVNSRETHMDMDGQTVLLSDYFDSPSGEYLEFPGDERADPSEVINCQCYMEILNADGVVIDED